MFRWDLNCNYSVQCLVTFIEFFWKMAYTVCRRQKFQDGNQFLIDAFCNSQVWTFPNRLNVYCDCFDLFSQCDEQQFLFTSHYSVSWYLKPEKSYFVWTVSRTDNEFLVKHLTTFPKNANVLQKPMTEKKYSNLKTSVGLLF